MCLQSCQQKQSIKKFVPQVDCWKSLKQQFIYNLI